MLVLELRCGSCVQLAMKAKIKRSGDATYQRQTGTMSLLFKICFFEGRESGRRPLRIGFVLAPRLLEEGTCCSDSLNNDQRVLNDHQRVL